MMQTKEFDKLFDPQNLDAKWADFGKVVNLGTKVEMRRVLKKEAVVMPQVMQEEIKALILKLRRDGHKQSKIKRIVKNTFNIVVI